MACVKTAVSIERETFEGGEAAARELGISRSDLYTRALRLLLRQRDMEALRERINTALADMPAADGREARRREAAMNEALHGAAHETMHRAIERGESTW